MISQKITSSEFKAILKDPWMNNLKKGIDRMTDVLKTKFPDYVISIVVNQHDAEISLVIEYGRGGPIFSTIFKLLRKELELTLDIYSENEDTRVCCCIKHTNKNHQHNKTTISILTLEFARLPKS